MGSKVQVLPDGLINQIAAGEVVERPASVVKELVENSLDAGATRVDVAIAEGGIRWISVQDDGSGLDPADAPVAFERHATSKIRSRKDLEEVGTLGFRGEALPSIASAARVRMRTRQAGRELGVELKGEGNGIRSVAELACPVGTRVEVSELFGRIPARRKFLKSAITEGTHIARWLERIALARPDVRFSLERDGKPVLAFLPTGDPRERAVAVLPTRVGGRLVEVRGALPNAELYGFSTPTDVYRGSANDIHLYVNARPVRDRLLLHAVRHAYRDALPPGRHPAGVLYLRIDPGEVDVNVHPAKSEVRFRDPASVRQLIVSSLTAALGLRGGSVDRESYESRPREFLAGESRPPADWTLTRPSRPEAVPASAVEFAGSPSVESAADPPQAPIDQPFATLRYLGQARGTYLVLEARDALVLLDQHAAHERVLFERLRQTLLAGKLERQALLVMEWMELPRSEADALEAYQGDLEQAGLELEFGESLPTGNVRVGLRTVPALLALRDRENWSELMSETASALAHPEAFEVRAGVEALAHRVIATAACHSSIRKGDALALAEVNALLEALDETVWFPNCPHGRPILKLFPKGQLASFFERS